MLDRLGTDATTALLVVITTIAMYLALVVFVRLLGQRTLASMSSFDLGCALALGAVIGRTTLLIEPTLLVGLVAMTTLFATQITLVRLRQTRWVDRLMNRPPVLLMAGATPLRDNLRASHVAEDELRQRLRMAGISDLAEVRCVVLERNGSVSVIRQGRSLDSWLLSDVPGADQLASPGRLPGD